jgi:chromosome segregation ATPase
MDNDRFQELVLEQLESLGNRMNRFESRQERFESGLQEMRADIRQLQDGQEQLRTKQQDIWTRIDTLVLSQKQTQQDINAMKVDIENIRQGQARVELELSGKVKALFDFRESQLETSRQVAARLDRLETKR